MQNKCQINVCIKTQLNISNMSIIIVFIILL